MTMTQLIKPQIKWTEEKISLLKKEYPNGDKKELCIKLRIKNTALKTAAQRFGVKSEKDLNFYKLKFLHEDSALSYYWLGFIMADGYIDKEGELKVTLSQKDLQHLKKLGDLLNVEVKEYKQKTAYCVEERNYCKLSCKDSFYGPLILKKMGLNGLPKTYNPPMDIEIKKDFYFICFLIGMIDGDGTFSKRDGKCNFIRLEMHFSWLQILQKIKNRLETVKIGNTAYGATKKGYAFLKIYKHNNLKALKLFAIKNNLPILERKWKSINENKDLKYHKQGDLPLNLEEFVNQCL